MPHTVCYPAANGLATILVVLLRICGKRRSRNHARQAYNTTALVTGDANPTDAADKDFLLN